MHDNWIKQEQQRRHRAYHFLFVSFTFFLLAIVLFVMMFVLPIVARAEDSVFSWLPNTESDLAGYKIHYGFESRSYTTTVDCGLPETGDNGRVRYTVPDTPTENTFYAATAYDTSGNESDFSDELSHDPPPSPVGGFVRTTVTTTTTTTVTVE